jgi:hypothetical protein
MGEAAQRPLRRRLGSRNRLAFAEFSRSTVEDIDLAVTAGTGTFKGWAATSVTDRVAVLIVIADRLQEHLEQIAVFESWENGKPVRETLAADIPRAIAIYGLGSGMWSRDTDIAYEARPTSRPSKTTKRSRTFSTTTIPSRSDSSPENRRARRGFHKAAPSLRLPEA